jgi:hypothetical protein
MTIADEIDALALTTRHHVEGHAAAKRRVAELETRLLDQDEIEWRAGVRAALTPTTPEPDHA